jgi:SPP1 gp7 family putative phage head morphogenesis protein
MPKALFANPDSAEREYTRAMLRYAREVNRASGSIILPKVGDIVGAYRREARLDSWGDDLARLIAEFLRVAGVMGAATIQTLPSRFEVVSNFNHAQFRMVVKANTGVDLPPKNPQGKRPSLLGVNVFQDEAYLQPIAEGWVAENTALIKDVPEKLAKDLEAIIRRGTMNGASVRDLQKQIRDRWPMTEHRAKLIAQDQTLKLNASLTRHRLESVGVKKYTWRSVMDNRVRPEHAEYNGKVYSWDKPPPDGNPGTPVRCVPSWSNIENAHGCSKLWRRTNRGELTKIVTETGKIVEATANHPILTNRGWVAIDRVNVGDYLICATQEGVNTIETDIKALPTKIGQIFDAVSRYVPSHMSVTPSASLEFNGDASNCEVETIDIGGFLPNMGDPLAIQQAGKLIFTLADSNHGISQFGVDSSLYLAASRLWYSTGSLVSGACKLLTLFAGHSAHSDEVRLTTISDFFSTLNKTSPDCRSAASILFGEGKLTDPASVIRNNTVNRQLFAAMLQLSRLRDDISLRSENLGEITAINSKLLSNGLQCDTSSAIIQHSSRVVQKGISEFSADHVYNLETAYHWYSSDTIIIHNCRCRSEAVWPKD